MNILEQSEYAFFIDIGDCRLDITLVVPFGNKNTSEELPFGLHSHNCNEIFFGESEGFDLYTQKGTLYFPPESVVIVPQGYVHCVVVNELYTMKVKVKSRIRNKRKGYYDFFTKKFTSDEPLLVENVRACFALFSEIHKCLKAEYAENEEYIETLIKLILLKLLKYSGKKTENTISTDVNNSTYISRIDKFVALHYMEKITLSQIADVLFISERQVSRIMKKYYGLTFHQYLVKHRLNVASNLLLVSNRTASEISALVGFDSLNTFFLQFKKRYGCTPLDYKNKNSKKI